MEYDAFREGVDIGGLFSTDAIKIMICCIFEQSDIPLTAENINNIFFEEQLANYFNLAQSLAELVRNGILIENDEQGYTLSENGHIIAKELAGTLASTTRNTAIAAAKKEIIMARKLKDNSIHIEQLDSDYIVTINMKSAGQKLMDFSFRVGTLEQANTIKKNFLEDPSELYYSTIKLLLGYDKEQR